MVDIKDSMDSMDSIDEARVEAITEYIFLNVLQSKVWDMADFITRRKAINTAERTLKRVLPEIYPKDEAIDMEHLAEQSIWIMKIDDSLQRSELGVKSITLDGISISMDQKDRSIAPFIVEANQLSLDALTGGVSKRKVGSYGTGPMDSYRRSQTPYKYYRRG